MKIKETVIIHNIQTETKKNEESIHGGGCIERDQVGWPVLAHYFCIRLILLIISLLLKLVVILLFSGEICSDNSATGILERKVLVSSGYIVTAATADHAPKLLAEVVAHEVVNERVHCRVRVQQDVRYFVHDVSVVVQEWRLWINESNFCGAFKILLIVVKKKQTDY